MPVPLVHHHALPQQLGELLRLLINPSRPVCPQCPASRFRSLERLRSGLLCSPFTDFSLRAQHDRDKHDPEPRARVIHLVPTVRYRWTAAMTGRVPRSLEAFRHPVSLIKLQWHQRLRKIRVEAASGLDRAILRACDTHTHAQQRAAGVPGRATLGAYAVMSTSRARAFVGKVWR